MTDLLLMCGYAPTNGKACSRHSLENSKFCALHFGSERKPTEEIIENPHFKSAFQTVIEHKDGDWRGFVFPSGIKLPKEIDFCIDASDSRFASFEQQDVKFKKSVNFLNAIFKGDFALTSSIFEDTVDFSSCRFEGAVDILNVQFKKQSKFNSTDFSGRTILRANFSESARFSDAVFRDVTIFTGWRNVNLKASDSVIMSSSSSGAIVSGQSKPTMTQTIRLKSAQIGNSLSKFKKSLFKKLEDSIKNARNRFLSMQRRLAKTDPDTQIFWMFEGEVHFEGVVFLKPDQISFSEVDLSKVYFRGTNLRGVRFLGVRWWQPIFKRNGLYDEVFIQQSKDGPFRYLKLPALEETCRNLRVALEENKSFNTASDFYIAEMEAARNQLPFIRRHLFSVAALYQAVSLYGTNVATALRMLFWLYLLHVTASFYFELPSGTLPQAHQLSDLLLRSLKVLLLTTPPPDGAKPPFIQPWLDITLRLLGPIQLAMVAIAFRSRIKRH